MNIIVVLFSVFFIGMAFLITEHNAKYLLAGYNTMSPEEREKVNIKGLILFFRNFFLVLGVSFMMIGLLPVHYFDALITSLFICIYPIIAVFYLLIKSQKFYIKNNN